MLSRETKQKSLLNSELLKISSLFTAEDLLKKAKTKDNRLGIATVYRFLKELKQKGKLHSYQCDRKTLYSKEKNSHCHFTCERCHKVSHFNIEKIDFIKNKIQGDVCHFQLDVSGVCKECSKS